MLTGSMGASWIQGEQNLGKLPPSTSSSTEDDDGTGFIVSASVLKHWAGYSFEQADGVNRYDFNAEISAYDWEHTYQAAWVPAVQDGRPAGVMCAYVAVNGTPSCMSSVLLDEQLRGGKDQPESSGALHAGAGAGAIGGGLGHDGFVISDGDAVELNLLGHWAGTDLADVVGKGIAAGCDMNSGYSYLHEAGEALKRGLFTQDRLRQAAFRAMLPRFRLGEFDPPASLPTANISTDVIGSPAHLQLARDAAMKGAVLLKNQPPNAPAVDSTGASAGGASSGASPLLPVTSFADMRRVVIVGPLADNAKATLGSYYTEPVGGFEGVQTVKKALEAAAAAGRAREQGDGPSITYI